MRNVATVLAAVAGATAGASGQESVRYEWHMSEVVAGTNLPVSSPDGVIEPGEAARIALTAVVLPGIGAPATFMPPPAPGEGTIAGLGIVRFDLLASSNAGTGQWSLLGQLSGWGVISVGVPAGNDIQGGGAGQSVYPGTYANSSNPVVDIWRGVWTPGEYSPRTVEFRSTAAAASPPGRNSVILIQYDPETERPFYFGLFVPGEFGSVQIPIVPGPGSLPTLLAGMGLVGRRPHRTEPRGYSPG